MTQPRKSVQAFPPKTNPLGDAPFSNDRLNRHKIAERLTAYINKLRGGTVIAIDAPWGEGKTWFGLNWAADLKTQEYRVILFDAFAHDYIDDPFIALSSEITRVIDNKEVFTRAAVNVATAIAPVVADVAINFAARFLLATPGLARDIKEAVAAGRDATENAASQIIRNRIENYNKEKESIEHFKTVLQDFCNRQNKPVIFIIDELDRCKPDYAVRLLERVKHFFDVTNMVFVLLVNQKQLQKYIKGVYGTEVDSASYLGKFINLTFRFPREALPQRIVTTDIQNFCSYVFSQYKFEDYTTVSEFPGDFSIMAEHFSLSLRSIEQGFALFALAQPLARVTNKYLAYLIALKSSAPDTFHKILSGFPDGIATAKTQLLEIIQERQDHGRRDGLPGHNPFWKIVAWLSSCQGTPQKDPHNQQAFENDWPQLRQENPDVVNPSQLMARLMHCIDFSPFI